MRHLLQLLLDLVRDLLLHLRCGGAWPRHVHDHHLDRERRIFGTAEVEVGVDASARQNDHHEEDERAVRDGPGGQIETLHWAVTPSVRLPTWLRGNLPAKNGEIILPRCCAP